MKPFRRIALFLLLTAGVFAQTNYVPPMAMAVLSGSTYVPFTAAGTTGQGLGYVQPFALNYLSTDDNMYHPCTIAICFAGSGGGGQTPVPATVNLYKGTNAVGGIESATPVVDYLPGTPVNQNFAMQVPQSATGSDQLPTMAPGPMWLFRQNGVLNVQFPDGPQAPIRSSVLPSTFNMVCVGDSRTAGNVISPAPSWCTQTVIGSQSQFAGHIASLNNFAVGGTGIADGINNYVAQVKPLCQAATPEVPTIVFLWYGYNDFNDVNKTAATEYAAFQSYIHGSQADGCRVIVATDMAGLYIQTTNGSAKRNAFNELISADQTWEIFDLDSLHIDPSSPNLMETDHVHQTPLTQYLIAQQINFTFGGPNPQKMSSTSNPYVDNAGFSQGWRYGDQTARTIWFLDYAGDTTGDVGSDSSGYNAPAGAMTRLASVMYNWGAPWCIGFTPFADTCPVSAVGDAAVKGTLQVGTIVAPFLSVEVQSPIASAATIAPTTGMAHLTGTATIATITPPFGISANSGCITLIADGAWTTTTTGNIFAVMAAVAGSPYTACYDGAKWYIK